MAERRQYSSGMRGGGERRGGRGRGGWGQQRHESSDAQQQDARPQRPMQILMRREQSPGRGGQAAAAAGAAVATQPTQDLDTSSSASHRNQRGHLDSSGVLAMLTGGGGRGERDGREGRGEEEGGEGGRVGGGGRPGSGDVRRGGYQQHPPQQTILSRRGEGEGREGGGRGGLTVDTRRREEQRKGEGKGGRPGAPQSAPLSATRDVTFLGGKKVMRDACRIMGDSGELSDYLMNTMMTDFLSDSNTDFGVYAAIGPQTTGKSTILSMMAGNQPLDLFRQYVFRPSSREAVEQSKHQSIKVNVYVSKTRNIFIDCQPLSCVSLLEEQLQMATRERGGGRMGEKMIVQSQVENIQIIAWALQVSHTVLVCHDWFIDLDIIKQIRTAELLRGAVDEIAKVNQLPKLAPERQTNLIFVHTRARPADFKTSNRHERANLIRQLFGDSLRIRIYPDFAECLQWDGPSSLARPSQETIYYPLAEMKLREMSNWPDEKAGGPQGGVHTRSNASPLSPPIRGGGGQQRAREREREKDRVKEVMDSLAGAIPFDEGIVALQRVLHVMPRESFTAPSAATAATGSAAAGQPQQQQLTEIQWFRFACGVWRDPTFRASAALYEATLSGRKKRRKNEERDCRSPMSERMGRMRVEE